MKKTIRSPRADLVVETPQKALFCGALADLNEHFEQIQECLGRLDGAGLFRGRFARQSIAICRASLHETRAWINFEVLQILHHRAEHDLAHFGRIRQRLEKVLEASSQRSGPNKR